MPIRMWIATYGRLRPRWDRLLTGPLLWWLMLWAAWAVRLWQLDANDLTFDEAATYLVTHRSLPDILTYLSRAVREHPPVYYVLIRLWISLAGTSEYSMRFFAVGASLLGIALTARLARTLARRLNVTDAVNLAIYTSLPALTLALFPLEVYYARDARMYTLTIVWASLSSLCFLPLLFNQGPLFNQGLLFNQGARFSGRGWSRWSVGRTSALIGLVLVNALALFTHYYLVFLIVAQFVSLLLLHRWRSLFAWSAAHGLVGLVGLVWLACAPGLAASLTREWGRFGSIQPTVDQLRRLLADLLFGPIWGVPWSLVYGWGLLVALGLLAAWLRPVHRWPAGQRSRVGGVWLTVTSLLPVALAFLMPEPPSPRYLTFVLPFAALALGQLLLLVVRSRLSIPIWLGLSALVISVLGVYGLPRTVTWVKSSYGRTIATVSTHARPGDGVLFYGPWQWLMFYYYQPDDFPPITALPPYAPPQLVPEEAEPVLQELLTAYQRLWVIPSAPYAVDPTYFVAGWLDTHAYPAWITPDLSLYLSPPEHETLSLPVELTFGDRLRLERLTSDAQTWNAAEPSVPAGEGLRLTLTWVVSDTLANDVELKLALLDERNQRWQEQVRVPGRWSAPPSTWAAGDAITDRQGVIVPQGAPPGPFRLELTVIDTASGTPLIPSDTAGPRRTERLPQPGVDLFTFNVIEPVASPVLADVDDFMGPFIFESPEGAADMLTLAGYGLGGLRFQQGYPVTLRLHWLAPRKPVPDLELRLQLWHQPRLALLGGQATPIATETLSLVPGYPVANWPPGRLVSLPTALPIPVDAAPGRAELTLAILSPDGQPWTVAGSQRLTLGTLTVEERPMLKKLPANLTTIQVDFGDQIGLRGYRIDGEAKPGGQLALNYAWYALRRPDRQYAVFNHLLTTDGQFITQVDGWPQDPHKEDAVVLTKQWRPGEYTPDRHTLEIPTDAPPGPYLLAVGLYDVDTVERLHASQHGQPLPNNQWLYRIDGGQ